MAKYEKFEEWMIGERVHWEGSSQYAPDSGVVRGMYYGDCNKLNVYWDATKLVQWVSAGDVTFEKDNKVEEPKTEQIIDWQVGQVVLDNIAGFVELSRIVKEVEMSKEHKYAEVLRWIADGREVQFTHPEMHGWKDLTALSQPVLSSFFAGEGEWQFRLAPLTITVNGVEVPAPESKAPSRHSAYFTADPSAEGFTWCFSWEDTEYDYVLLERGLVYLRQEDAIARAKAMLLTQE